MDDSRLSYKTTRSTSHRPDDTTTACKASRICAPDGARACLTLPTVRWALYVRRSGANPSGSRRSWTSS